MYSHLLPVDYWPTFILNSEIVGLDILVKLLPCDFPDFTVTFIIYNPKM